MDTDCDIKLSVQYDKIIKDTDKCFNVHTGLLPEYGGTNILDYTIQNGEYQQGLTFHKMTDKLDFGPIISKITYPVFPEDKAFDLYHEASKLPGAPWFAHSNLGRYFLLGIGNVESSFEMAKEYFTKAKELGGEHATTASLYLEWLEEKKQSKIAPQSKNFWVFFTSFFK